MNEEIKELLVFWNINSEILQIHNNAWSIGNRYVIKANDDFENLQRNITIMKALNESGIPVAHPIPTAEGLDYVKYNEKYYMMMNQLEGIHISDIYKSDYLNIAYTTGKIIAKLHTAFIPCEGKIAIWNNSLLEEMEGWVYDSLKANNFPYITASDFENNLEQLKDCYNKLPEQLIHRDLHFGNILFKDGEFSGYIDFDLSQKNIRIFDICYFLLGLLIDHNNKDDIKKWFDIISNFIKGYELLKPLTILEKENICCIMKSIELLFIAYFTDTKNNAFAKSSSDLYYFVKENEEKIKSVCL